ncbi:hypothetical protein [Clostridium thailandense]|uniref:Uncharacterized protein n=1 Tax=Clostridium thailandense TaxID=2794346 RepID=A0A949X478_9CLOT|nr:hypothetical protein [Clostridium thailandense]MBV7273558.1 hypothetical protein [Clostridium thailandense]
MNNKKLLEKTNSKSVMNSKEESMKDHSQNSLDSKTGYMDHGNESVYQAKGRVMRNNDNGSHF